KGSIRRACIATVSGLPNGITSTVTAATTSTDGKISLAIAKESTLGNLLHGLITITLTCESESFFRNISWVKIIDATAIQQKLESQGGTIEDLSNSLNGVAARVTSAEGTITAHNSSISQNADSIALKVQAVDDQGNAVSEAKIVVGTKDNNGIIKLDAEEVIMEGTVKASKLDVDDLLAKDLVVGNKIRSSNFASGSKGYCLGSDGKLEAISAVLNNVSITGDGEFKGKIDSPSLKTTFATPGGSQMTYSQSKNYWEADTLFNSGCNPSYNSALDNPNQSSSGYISGNYNAYNYRVSAGSNKGTINGQAMLYFSKQLSSIWGGQYNQYYYLIRAGQDEPTSFTLRAKTNMTINIENTKSRINGGEWVNYNGVFNLNIGDVLELYKKEYGMHINVNGSSNISKGVWIFTLNSNNSINDLDVYVFQPGQIYSASEYVLNNIDLNVSGVTGSSPFSSSNSKTHRLASLSDFSSLISGKYYQCTGNSDSNPSVIYDSSGSIIGYISMVHRDGNKLSIFYGSPSLIFNETEGSYYPNTFQFYALASSDGVIAANITAMNTNNIISGFASITAGTMSATTINGTSVWGAVAN
ncbi:MAG: hypothetical protein GX896_10650, partial [Clostridiales bacterium]|nr:hypothetical protein [Clostridiales bacterium]